MSQVQVPTLEVLEPTAPTSAPIDVQSIVQAATEAARQVAMTTATAQVTAHHAASGPMRRRYKNTPKPAAIKLGFNLRGARTK
jgi:hypothetical protein